MMGFQGTRLVGQTLPVVRSGPWDGEDFMGQNTRGVHCLPELPVSEMCRAAEGIKEGGGGVRGAVATGFGPRFGPADVVFAGGGPDGKRGDSPEEALAGRSGGLFRRCRGWWRGHEQTNNCSNERRQV